MKFIVTPPNHLGFLKRFIISRTSAYAIQTKDGRYRKVEKELTDAAIIRHLEHKITIGLYNSDENGRCKFCLWDIDNHEGKNIISEEIVKEKVSRIKTTLNEFGVPFTLAESSPGSFHIYVFFDPPASTSKSYRFARWVARNADAGEIECFPKQSIVPPGEYGNLIRAPFSLHQKKKTSYHYINTEFDHKDVFEVKTIDISGFIPPHDRTKPMTEALKEDEPIGMKPTTTTSGGIPPCMEQSLTSGIQFTGSGGHYMRICLVCAYRDAGLPFAALCRLFTGQDDYDQVETAKQVKSILRKEGGYSYSCRTLREKCSRFTDCQNCPRGKHLNRMASKVNTTETRRLK